MHVCQHAYMYTTGMSGIYRDQMGASDSLELDLPMVVSHHECTEETKPRSSVRAASALSSHAIPPAPSILQIPTHIGWVENANSCLEPEMHLIGHGGTDALKNNLEKPSLVVIADFYLLTTP